jgi:hypothetical protein
MDTARAARPILVIATDHPQRAMSSESHLQDLKRIMAPAGQHRLQPVALPSPDELDASTAALAADDLDIRTLDPPRRSMWWLAGGAVVLIAGVVAAGLYAFTPFGRHEQGAQRDAAPALPPAETAVSPPSASPSAPHVAGTPAPGAASTPAPAILARPPVETPAAATATLAESDLTGPATDGLQPPRRVRTVPIYVRNDQEVRTPAAR